MQMLSDLGELVAAIYFSSLLFFIVPVLGAAAGAVTARLNRVNIGLGLLIGLVSGLSGIGLAMFVYWAYGGNGPGWLSFLTAYVLPSGGAFTPIAILPLFRLRSDKSSFNP